MEFECYLKEQLALHPSTEPQDVVKLCYQAAFGAEHLLSDLDRVKTYLEQEYLAVPAGDGPLYEKISDRVCRVDLSRWKASGMPLEWLLRMFTASAKVQENGAQTFESYLRASETVLQNFPVSFSLGDWSQYLVRYKEKGISPVHHSDRYRQAEHPAYRIADSRFCGILPILQRAAEYLDREQPCVIAIDGRAASGKSTLADTLALVLDAPVIHMDDFFLPPGLRTAERLQEPGGNIHYERFCQEVLPQLGEKKPFSYRIFDCGVMDYAGHREISESAIRIVEGSYSCHPIFGNYGDVRVFVDVAPELQLQRIRDRNGEAMLSAFRDQWIPMEERYFAHYPIREAADVVLEMG